MRTFLFTTFQPENNYRPHFSNLSELQFPHYHCTKGECGIYLTELFRRLHENTFLRLLMQYLAHSKGFLIIRCDGMLKESSGKKKNMEETGPTVKEKLSIFNK